MNILDTPFKVKTNHEYPPKNNTIFEEYFYNWFIQNNPVTKKTYLPIFWTNYYIDKRNQRGEINVFLNKLDKSKEYFTIVQWDDGIMNHPFPSNIFVFGQGGGSGRPNCTIGNYAIPLICEPNPSLELKENKTIFASFKGSMVGRHWVREKLLNAVGSNKDYVIEDITGKVNYNSFSNLMSSSIFSLCPRGYGATSFRICEALQHGSIPVYISDVPWIPFKDLIDFNEYGVIIDVNDIHKIDSILKGISQEQINDKLKKGRIVYEQYYSYQGCASKIIEIVNR